MTAIMNMWIAALLLAASYSGETCGRLFVHVPVGLEVLVDGVSAGVSSAEEGGKLVRNVAPGSHRVTIRSTDGREASVITSVAERQTTEITVSPLGLRKIPTPAGDEMSLLRVVSIPEEASVEFHGSVKENHDASELTFDAIPAGRYPLIVSQGKKTVRADIDVPKASVVTVEVNFASATIRTTNSRPRPRRLQIAEPNDALLRLNVPSHWKTAIRSALPSTVSIVAAIEVENGVKVRLKVPTNDVGESLMQSLQSSPAFSHVVMTSYPHREQIGWIVDFAFYFPAGH